MRRIKFTRNDLNTELKLEKLLLEITRCLADVEDRSLQGLSGLAVSLNQRLTEIESRTSQRVSALEGGISRALATSPAGVAVYDEQTNQWYNNPNASGVQTGIVTLDSQTFGGNKTFQDNVIVGSDLTVHGIEYLGDTQWRFTHSDSHLNVEYWNGVAWGVKGTFIP